MTISIDRHVGAVAPVVGGGYVLAAGPGFLFVGEDGSVQELAQPEVGRTDVRMNDGACDPQGRFWAGTMAYDESPGAGALYRLELDGSCTTVLTGLTIANGIGWSPDARTMYLNDSGTGCIEAFRFESSTGAITDRRTLLRNPRLGVVPDGLTVDAEGGIWVAWWGGGAVTGTPPTARSLPASSFPSSVRDKTGKAPPAQHARTDHHHPRQRGQHKQRLGAVSRREGPQRRAGGERRGRGGGDHHQPRADRHPAADRASHAGVQPVDRIHAHMHGRRHPVRNACDRVRNPSDSIPAQRAAIRPQRPHPRRQPGHAGPAQEPRSGSAAAVSGKDAALRAALGGHRGGPHADPHAGEPHASPPPPYPPPQPYEQPVCRSRLAYQLDLDPTSQTPSRSVDSSISTAAASA